MVYRISIKVKKDTLYFKYKVINNTAKNLLLYHFQAFDVKLESYTESDYPKCSIHIINSNNKLPETGIAQHRDYFVVDSNNKIKMYDLPKYPPEYNPYAYILLPTESNKTFAGKYYIGNYQLLGKSFKLKLKYLSPYNPVFINHFKKIQTKSQKLKQYEKFEGIIESNCCPFTLYQK